MPKSTLYNPHFLTRSGLCCLFILLLASALATAQSTLPLSATLTATPAVLTPTSVATLSATVRGGTAPYSYTFNGPGAITANGSASATVTGLAPGVQSFTVTTRDSGTLVSGTLVSQTTTAIVNVTVTGASLNGPSTICSGQSATLTVNVTGGTGPFTVIYASASSSTTGIVTSNVTNYTSGAPIVVTPATSTTYTLLSVASFNGTTFPVAGVLPITVAAPPNINILGSPVLCNSNATTITATGGTSYTLVSATFPQSNTSGIFTLFNAGSYTISASNGACSRPFVFSVSTGEGLPNVTITPSSTALTCSTTSVSLVASAGGANYFFSGPTSLTQSGPSNVFVVNQPGFYSVIATGINGCVSTTTVQITGSSAGPTGTLTSSGVITCANPVGSLSATGAPTGSAYIFAGPNGFLRSSMVGSLTVSTPGEYSVLITGSNGCRTTLATTVASNTAPPGADIFLLTADGNISCSTPSGSLQASRLNFQVPVREYVFNGPGVGLVITPTPSLSVNQPGIYSVLIIGENGCTSAASTSVGLTRDVTTATLLPRGGSNQLTCAQTSLTLVATGVGSTYRFSGPGISSFGPSNTVVVSQPGNYFVTVEGPPGCSATAVSSVISNTFSLPPSVAASGLLGCPPSSITLSTGISGPTYIYTGPNGYNTTTTSGSAVITEAGTYTLITISAGSSCTTVTLVPVISFCDTKTTATPPSTAFALVAPAYNCQTGAITLLTSGGDGSPITFFTPGIMRTSPQSATGIVEAGLRFDPKPITLQATQNGKTVTYVFDLASFCKGARLANTEVASGLTITVLGNPTTSEAISVEVRGAEGKRLSYQIRDLSGRLISERQTEQAAEVDQQTLRLGNSSGLYLLNITSPDQRKTVKVVRQ